MLQPVLGRISRRDYAVIRRIDTSAPLPARPRELRQFPVPRALSACRLPTLRRSTETPRLQGPGSAAPLHTTRAPILISRCIPNACHPTRRLSPLGRIRHRPACRLQGACRDNLHPKDRSASIPECQVRRIPSLHGILEEQEPSERRAPCSRSHQIARVKTILMI